MPQNWFHSRDHYSDNEVHEEEAATEGGQQDNTFEGLEDNQPGLGVSRFGRVRRKSQYLGDYDTGLRFLMDNNFLVNALC